MAEAEAYLTEIKAAAVDVVTRQGAEEGKPVFYCDNDPVGEGLDEELLRWRGRPSRRRRALVDPGRLVYNRGVR